MTETERPGLASTIVLVDDEGRIYLVKRHGRSGFMAGAHVFPGGRVDATDREIALALPPSLREAGQGLVQRGATNLDDALALLVAGVRETVEECAVFLATSAHAPGGALVDGTVAAEAHRLLEVEKRPFADVLATLGVVPAIDRLAPFAWWITPEAEPRRYDTRFFVARAPHDQRATVDAREVTEGDWMTPDDAIARYRRREIALAPPTLVTLEDLQGARTVDAMIARGAQTAGRPICPKLIADEQGLVLALPGDALHDEREPIFPGVRTRVVMDADQRFVSAMGPTP